jgi:predicted dienelactone hydrolase
MQFVRGYVLCAAAFLAACAHVEHTDVEQAVVLIGRQHREYADVSRTDWQNSGARPLSATIWYPAAASSDTSESNAGFFQFGSHAIDAPLVDEIPRPLIIVSHGTGGSAAQLSWLARSLAEAGFIVAGVNHHGNTAAEKHQSPHGFLLPGERVRDVKILIDQLLSDPAFGAHIDPSRIGIAGFSIGGYTALASLGAQISMDQRQERCGLSPDNPVCILPPEAEFTLSEVDRLAREDEAFQSGLARDAEVVLDPRIRAAYSIAPAFVSLMHADDFARLKVPVRLVLAEDDQQILFAKTRDVVASSLPTASVLSIPSAGHYVFLATCSSQGVQLLPRFCADAAGVDRASVHQQVGRDAVQFFRSRL